MFLTWQSQWKNPLMLETIAWSVLGCRWNRRSEGLRNGAQVILLEWPLLLTFVDNNPQSTYSRAGESVKTYFDLTECTCVLLKYRLIWRNSKLWNLFQDVFNHRRKRMKASWMSLKGSQMTREIFLFWIKQQKITKSFLGHCGVSSLNVRVHLKRWFMRTVVQFAIGMNITRSN